MSQIDFTYEEVSCDRNIMNSNFLTGYKHSDLVYQVLTVEYGFLQCPILW